jgi:hypothetical protein
MDILFYDFHTNSIEILQYCKFVTFYKFYKFVKFVLLWIYFA